LKSRSMERFTHQDHVKIGRACMHMVSLGYVSIPTQTGGDGNRPEVDLTPSEETSPRDTPNNAESTAGSTIHSGRRRICVSRVLSHKNECNRSEDKRREESGSQSLTQRGWARPCRRGAIPSWIHTRIHTQTGGSTAHRVRA